MRLVLFKSARTVNNFGSASYRFSVLPHTGGEIKSIWNKLRSNPGPLAPQDITLFIGMQLTQLQFVHTRLNIFLYRVTMTPQKTLSNGNQVLVLEAKFCLARSFARSMP